MNFQKEILNIMNLDEQEKKLKSINDADIFKYDLKFDKMSILFRKIEDDN